MKIIKTELFTFKIKYREPFRIAVENKSVKYGILVKITTQSGLVGLGEAAPAEYTTFETPESCRKALLKNIFPVIKGVRAEDFKKIHILMDRAIKGNTSSKAAVDMALYDIAAKAKNMPLYKYLGGKKNKIQTDMTVSIKSPKLMAEKAKKFAQKGFRIIKIKLGTTPKEDIERIRKIRKAVGDKIILRVDANQGWKNFNLAAEAINGMEKYDLELVEQPLRWDDFDGFKKLRKLVNILLAADESAKSLTHVKRLIKDGSADIINIKLMKCGGIYRAIEIADFCKKHNTACMIGGMCETRIAVAASMHLACAIDAFKYADLDGDLLIDDKLVIKSSLGLKRDHRILKPYPGLGIIKINEEVLL
ncbi:MAG: dipeptide epimerase [Armatimonadota bacterium]